MKDKNRVQYECMCPEEEELPCFVEHDSRSGCQRRPWRRWQSKNLSHLRAKCSFGNIHIPSESVATTKTCFITRCASLLCLSCPLFCRMRNKKEASNLRDQRATRSCVLCISVYIREASYLSLISSLKYKGLFFFSLSVSAHWFGCPAHFYALEHWGPLPLATLVE